MISQHQQEQSDFSDAWKEPPTVEVDSDQPGEQGDKPLADRLEAGEGEKYAAGPGFKGDGVMTSAEHAEYAKAMGEFIDGTPVNKDKPEEAKATYSHGKDDANSLSTKQRLWDQNRDGNIKKLMATGLSRKSAEAQHDPSRPK